ncbi:LLM class flavin-dependent oxidoreductase [Tsukamurella paurometabola]|uniref:F420-dependent oxidoreductase, MSMEG_4879 family n=1 Tax=Tsukamurella paurometabola TaxID=2061 RepID=A0A3P8MD49_TSUPA|nr:LLM class flavin-dependent oxidoreductase [Tsukamurella paurometabola]MBS4103837.1 LLM class flavin-dependent oxidoreductase [Tsukamurella paurometabola]UEA81449.1 LLM class flavin-dependent oxidoreductase [Tsukamurella paurometabola]VDR38443.1 F420-dependent oxidoreductase, MSMEG_4879 family [Tsukamurella paurometabola]
MKISLVAPVVPAHPDQLLGAASLVQDRLYSRMWQGQSYGIDAIPTFAYLAGKGYRIPYGTAVSVSALTDPRRAAIESRSVAVLSGEPFYLGVGPGSARIRSLLGETGGPVAATEHYLATFRSELETAGDRTSLAYPIPSPEVRTAIGVLRPAMARLAGRVADAAISWMCTPEYIAEHVITPMAAEAAGHDRERPGVVAMMAAGVLADDRDPLLLAHAGVGRHAQEPHYRAVLERSGVPVSSDLHRSASALLDSGLFCYGTPAHIAKQVHRYRDAGVTEVALSLTSTAAVHGLSTAVDDLRAISVALESLQESE